MRSSDPAIAAAISLSGGRDCEVKFVYAVQHERSLQIGDEAREIRRGASSGSEGSCGGRSRAPCVLQTVVFLFLFSRFFLFSLG